MTGPSISDRIAAIFAQEAGAEPGTREFKSCQNMAIRAMIECDHAPPADPTSEVGIILLEHYERTTAARAEASAQAAASRARVEALKAARDRPAGLRDGFVRMQLKDEATGKRFWVDFPSENVRQVGI